jgi:hypothetical protein
MLKEMMIPIETFNKSMPKELVILIETLTKIYVQRIDDSI